MSIHVLREVEGTFALERSDAALLALADAVAAAQPEPEAAVARRAEQELGTRVGSIEPAVPDFRYRAVDDSGIVENEICPVFTARIRADLNPRADEVCAHHWARPEDVRTAVDATPFAFSPWLVAQVLRMELYAR